jgi:hypothetical protein
MGVERRIFRIMIRTIARLMWAIFWGIPLVAQTQVDLRTQTKSVDFQTAPFTKPLKSGTTLPSVCTQAELFYLSTAAPGANIYACVSPNTWALETGGGSASITVQNSGVTVGTQPMLNYSIGTGLLLATSSISGAIAIQLSADTSLVQTRTSEQSGATLLCNSSSGSGAVYTCSLAPTLTTYTTGMTLNWKPDLNGTGGATTLNVDNLGAVSIKLGDGSTDPGPGDLVAGRLYQIWHDGTSLRLLSQITPAGILGEAQPSCGAPVRGRLWFVAGGTGVKDGLNVCAKDATGAFAWRILY